MTEGRVLPAVHLLVVIAIFLAVGGGDAEGRVVFLLFLEACLIPFFIPLPRRHRIAAAVHGAGFVAVSNCSHLGYVGYWAKMAMEGGFIGISMTNGGGVVTPTFGVEPMLGTNPMSVAFPGGPEGHDYHLDMATATVARGKVETTLREGH